MPTRVSEEKDLRRSYLTTSSFSTSSWPAPALEAVRGADLLLIEAALRLTSHDDPRRGHLTPEEAIDLATRATALQAARDGGRLTRIRLRDLFA